jgi:16S rRNA (guanine966-N2)-methyltransferase
MLIHCAEHPGWREMARQTVTLRGMTRVIAGTAGGRRLSVPAGRGTRPTSDRAREGLFATVQAIHGPLTGASVLDLYAGSGAVGLEALSRGAARALLAEADPRAVRVIRANIAALGLAGACVAADRVERVLARGQAGHQAAGRQAAGPDTAGAGRRFGLAFADPPYAMTGDAVSAMLGTLIEAGWLAPGALVVVERSTRSGAVRWPEGYTGDRSRRYGEATLWYGLATSALLA